MGQLFIGPTCLGDAILTTGLIDHMQRDRPDLPLTIACGPPAALMLRSVPGLAALHVMRKQPRAGHWLTLWNAVRGQRWARVVDMRRSALAWVLRADARHLVPRGHPGEHRVPLAARTLGLPPLDPRVWITDAQHAHAARLLPGDAPTLALGTGANWVCKTWPADRFAALALALTRPGAALAGGRILLVGSNDERDAARPLFDALPPAAIVDGFGLDIPTTAALLARSTLFVGNDSAMMHLAAAAGTRTAGLFGPTRDDLYAPWGPSSLVVRTAEPVDQLLARVGPPGSERTLMEGLAVDGVVQAIARRWPGFDARNA